MTFSAETNEGDQEVVPPFAEALAALDRDKDRKLSKDDFGDPFLREDGTWTLDVKTRAGVAPRATPRG